MEAPWKPSRLQPYIGAFGAEASAKPSPIVAPSGPTRTRLLSTLFCGRQRDFPVGHVAKIVEQVGELAVRQGRDRKLGILAGGPAAWALSWHRSDGEAHKAQIFGRVVWDVKIRPDRCIATEVQGMADRAIFFVPA